MEQMISVIIPVYNAEGFVGKCLESLCGQSYKNLEIIVVDDGSTDNSLALCEDYATRDQRIVVLHQENQGVSAARNLGLENAAGDYIAFVDADDYAKPDYFEVLYRDIIVHNADMSCCDMIELLDGQQVFLSGPRVRTERLVTESAELYRDLVTEQEGYGSVVWAKLIKAELAKKHTFPRNVKFGEDQMYIYKLFSEKPVVYLSTYGGYYYVRNDSSATMRKVDNNIPRLFDELEMFRYKALNLPVFAESHNAGFFEKYAEWIYLTAVEIATKGHGEEAKAGNQRLKGYLKEIPRELLKRKTLTKVIVFQYLSGLLGFVYKTKSKLKK